MFCLTSLSVNHLGLSVLQRFCSSLEYSGYLWGCDTGSRLGWEMAVFRNEQRRSDSVRGQRLFLREIGWKVLTSIFLVSSGLGRAWPFHLFTNYTAFSSSVKNLTLPQRNLCLGSSPQWCPVPGQEAVGTNWKAGASLWMPGSASVLCRCCRWHRLPGGCGSPPGRSSNAARAWLWAPCSGRPCLSRVWTRWTQMSLPPSAILLLWFFTWQLKTKIWSDLFSRVKKVKGRRETTVKSINLPI